MKIEGFHFLHKIIKLTQIQGLFGLKLFKIQGIF